MSTFYLAGRLDSGEASIAALAAELESRGHTVLEKWWELGRLPQPYLSNPATSAPAAAAMIAAAVESDVYVLFPAANILGAAVEFGAALAAARVNPAKQIYVVDPASTRQSVFFAHPLVQTVTSVAELRAQAWW